jgi:hypothetical protein
MVSVNNRQIWQVYNPNIMSIDTDSGITMKGKNSPSIGDSYHQLDIYPST